MAAAKDLWTQAVSSLSNHDKLSVDFSRTDKPAILEVILVAAEAKRQTCMQKRWKYKRRDGNVIIIRDVCEKLINWVRKFKGIKRYCCAIPYCSCYFTMGSCTFPSPIVD